MQRCYSSQFALGLHRVLSLTRAPPSSLFYLLTQRFFCAGRQIALLLTTPVLSARLSVCLCVCHTRYPRV